MAAAVLYSNTAPGFFIPNGLVDTSLLDCFEKMVYMVVKRHLNSKSKVAWPGLRRIAKEAGISMVSVRKALEGLEDKGVLDVERGKDEKGAFKVNVYRFTDTIATWEAETIEEMKAAAYRRPVTVEDEWKQAAELLKHLNVPQAVIDSLYQYSTVEEDKEKGLSEVAASESPESSAMHKNTNVHKKNNAEMPGAQVKTVQTEKLPENFEGVPAVDRGVYAVALLAFQDALRDAKTAEDRQAVQALGKAGLLEAVGRMKGQKGIKNIRRYLKGILLNMAQAATLEAQEPTKRPGKSGEHPAGTFANFEQRQYDYKSLERRLLEAQGDTGPGV